MQLIAAQRAQQAAFGQMMPQPIHAHPQAQAGVPYQGEAVHPGFGDAATQDRTRLLEDNVRELEDRVESLNARNEELTNRNMGLDARTQELTAHAQDLEALKPSHRRLKIAHRLPKHAPDILKPKGVP